MHGRQLEFRADQAECPWRKTKAHSPHLAIRGSGSWPEGERCTACWRSVNVLILIPRPNDCRVNLDCIRAACQGVILQNGKHLGQWSTDDAPSLRVDEVDIVDADLVAGLEGVSV